MMSSQQVNQLADEAARRAKREGKKPIVFTAEELNDEVKLAAHVRRIPFVGTYRPAGYKLIPASSLDFPRKDCVCVPWGGDEAERYVQVDSSGWGSPNEPALTATQFYDAIRAIGPGRAYAIVEAGQFQCVIGIFERVEAKVEQRRRIVR